MLSSIKGGIDFKQRRTEEQLQPIEVDYKDQQEGETGIKFGIHVPVLLLLRITTITL